MRPIGKLRSAARRVLNLSAPGALVLLYHRVTELSCDPQALAVSPRHFAEHLEILRRQATPLALSRLKHAAARRGMRRPVVLTLDDGYADSLLEAHPVLSRHEIPATFFIVAGFIGAGREFFW